mgnify:CR=1 FL=1
MTDRESDERPIFIERLGIDTPSYFSLLGLADISENIQSPDDVIPEYFGFIVEGVRMRVNARRSAALAAQ